MTISEILAEIEKALGDAEHKVRAEAVVTGQTDTETRIEYRCSGLPPPVTMLNSRFGPMPVPCWCGRSQTTSGHTMECTRNLILFTAVINRSMAEKEAAAFMADPFGQKVVGQA